MNDMYSSGLPYSDEIYHYGIPGQKWGVRRFQNPDGSLTSEGRKRYSKGGSERNTSTVKTGARKSGKEFVKGAAAVSVKAASRLGEGIARGVKTKLAEKMPYMLNDEELERYRDRLRRENTYRNEMANRRELKRRAQGDQFAKKLIQDVASTSVKNIVDKGTRKLADELFKTATDRQKEQLEIEAKELKNEQEREKASKARLNTQMNEDIQEAREAYEEKTKYEETRDKAKESRERHEKEFYSLSDERRKLIEDNAKSNIYDPDYDKKLKKLNQKMDDVYSKLNQSRKDEKKYDAFASKYSSIMNKKMNTVKDTKEKLDKLNSSGSGKFNEDAFLSKIVDALDERYSRKEDDD